MSRGKWWRAVCLVSAIGWPGLATAACTLNVGWEPYGFYSYRDVVGDVAGYDIDVVRALAQEVGCTVLFEELPFSRILLEIERGGIDATSSIKISPERERYGLFSTGYRDARVGLYVRRGEAAKLALRELADLATTEARVGAVAGYYLGEDYERLLQQPEFSARVELASNQETNVRKLVFGRIDAFLSDDDTVVREIALRLGVAAQIERHPLPLEEVSLRLMFSRRTVAPELVEKIDAALEKMRAEGRLDAMLEAYLQTR